MQVAILNFAETDIDEETDTTMAIRINKNADDKLKICWLLDKQPCDGATPYELHLRTNTGWTRIIKLYEPPLLLP